MSPDIFLCFEQVWQEPQAVARQNGGRVCTKAFFLETWSDNCSSRCVLMCYLQDKIESLAMVQVEENQSSTGYRLGAVSHVPAVDAAPIPSLGMVLVLEQGKQALALYSSMVKLHLTLFLHDLLNTLLSFSQSGQVKVGRVLFDANPLSKTVAKLTGACAGSMSRIATEISAMNLGSAPSTPLTSKVATSSLPPSAHASFSESFVQMSPVRSNAASAISHRKAPRSIDRLGESVQNQVRRSATCSTFSI